MGIADRTPDTNAVVANEAGTPSADLDPGVTFVSGFLEQADLASRIYAAVRADLKPTTPLEALLVEEIAELTTELRSLKYRRDLVLRTRAFDFVHQDILNLQKLGRLDGEKEDLRTLVYQWAFGGPEAHARAAKRLAALGVSLDGAMARAAAACVDDLDTIDRASNRARGQRERLRADFQAQRMARERAEVPDAEVVE